MEGKSVFYRAFVRDHGVCVFCGKNLMNSFDSFAQIQLDHLKPRSNGGSDDINNRVISCFGCNNLKGSFDPTPEVELDHENRGFYIRAAREYVSRKRNGEVNNSLRSNYDFWLKEFNSIQN